MLYLSTKVAHSELNKAKFSHVTQFMFDLCEQNQLMCAYYRTFTNCVNCLTGFSVLFIVGHIWFEIYTERPY